MRGHRGIRLAGLSIFVMLLSGVLTGCGTSDQLRVSLHQRQTYAPLPNVLCELTYQPRVAAGRGVTPKPVEAVTGPDGVATLPLKPWPADRLRLTVAGVRFDLTEAILQARGELRTDRFVAEVQRLEGSD